MSNVARHGVVAVLCAAALSALPASAQVAGPIEVFTNSFQPSYPQGGITDLGCGVANHLSDSTVGVVIEANVAYAGGSTQTVHRRSSKLTPDTTVFLFIASLVPADAALGTAVFECSARVTSITGGTNHSDYANPLVASHASPFQVVAP